MSTGNSPRRRLAPSDDSLRDGGLDMTLSHSSLKTNLGQENSSLETKPSTRPRNSQQSPSRVAGTALCVAGLVLYLLRSSSFFASSSYTLCTRGGARIYTVTDAKPRVECIVVNDKRIEATGSFDELHGREQGLLARVVPSLLWQTTRPIHWVEHGGAVVPGIADAHAHILAYGQSRQLDVRDAQSPQEVVARIREYLDRHPEIRDDPTRWIEGAGFDHTGWPGGKFPTASDLETDPVVRGRFIAIHSKDAHAIWVSQAALDKYCPCKDVHGGTITRDDKGNANGIFIDDASELIKIPPPTEAVKEQWFLTAMKDAVEHGLTAIHDAGLEAASVPFFQRMADENKLPIRIYAMRWYDMNASYWGKEKAIVGYGGGRLSIRSVKLFTDGALRTGGAALYEPYTDNPSTSGVLRIPPDVLHEIIPKFLADGWQVNTHAIGDRANGIFLDVMESVSPDLVRARRPRVEHAQIVASADLKRFGDLGVIASVQPTHATDDMWYAEGRLGPKRIKGTYAWRSLVQGGAVVVTGSDAPVEGISPFAGFYAAVTRLTPDGASPHGPGGWFPEERLTRQEALKGMTIAAAYASFTEHMTGSLEVGKQADLVILDRDIMTVPTREILDTRVLATVVDGKAAYGTL